MARKIIITVLILSMHGYFAYGSSAAEFERRLYNSYVEGRMSDWKGIMREMTLKYEQDNETDLLYSLSFAQYGYLGYCLAHDMNEEADELVDEAIGNTKKLYKLLDGRPDVSALWGALLGFKIVLSNYNSIHVGPKSLRLIKSSSDSGDKYFNTSLEMANLLFYTPKILGGSKEEAMDYYRKAVKVIDQSNLKEDRNWIYINTVLLLANAYSETGSQKLACDLYEGLLEYEPRAAWIKEGLLSDCGE